VCAYVDGEYGLKDIYLGVPCIIGKNGVERIITLNLDEEEKKLLIDSAKSVKETMNILDEMKLF
jgi:malate dehydrogenase